ncbi:MAG: hypothetical protein IPO56_08180 [Flavobacteriales bacterium]|nr:hypothetical protein [Flavobacteriales bacterium]
MERTTSSNTAWTPTTAKKKPQIRRKIRLVTLFLAVITTIEVTLGAY